MSEPLDSDYVWFRSRLPEFLNGHRGEHALVHARSVVGYFSSSLEAVKAGMANFGEGNFLVEPVDDTVEDLGFYSHVSSALRA